MHAILIDDEPLALDVLENRIHSVSKLKVIEKFVSFDIEKHKAILNKADIIFLDIEMPNQNGLHLAKYLQEYHPHIMIVFVTAYDQYAVEAFEMNVLDYLLKPIHKERLKGTIQKAECILKANSKTNDKAINESEITVSDRLEIVKQGKAQATLKWSSLKSRELLLYFFIYHNKKIHRHTILQALWSEHTIEQATQRLHNTISQIRKLIAPYQHYMSIEYRDEYYLFSLSHVNFENKVWEEKIDLLPRLNKSTVDEYEEVLTQRRDGRFFVDEDYEWLEVERYRLQELWKKTTLKLSIYYYDLKKYDKAELLLRQLYDYSPEDEKINLLLMKIYAILSYDVLVDYQYTILKKELNEIGLVITDEIRNWYRHYKHTNT